MTNQTRNILIGFVIIIVVLILGYFAWQERGASQPTTATSTAATSTGTAVDISSTTPSGPGYTINPIYAPKAPDYTASLTFSPSVSADERTSLQSQFAQIQATIRTSPNDFNAWVALGGTHKQAGDYVGAALDWEYVGVLYPTNVVSFANLADLYTSFLPNYPKAAAAYKQAIKNDPKRADLYMSLFSLYTNQYPQSAATAEAVLQQGITANPGAADLKAALATYQSAHAGQ